MGPQHAYGLAARLEQVSNDPFPFNQGTLYAALIRLEQRGWIKGAWKRTDTNRDAKYLLAHTLRSTRVDRADEALASISRTCRKTLGDGVMRCGT